MVAARHAYHATVANERTAAAERVAEDIKRPDGAALEVPERAPCRVVINLKRVVRGAIEEEHEGRGDDDRLECDNARRLCLEIEAPAGSGRRRGGEGREEWEESELHGLAELRGYGSR